ncbi:hypothetical protein ACQ86E_33545 [Bradyrhizobium betae]|uniref:hypothetical protein n=1 Tax=Bradyrhizobium betae TaxID=244734 RepID=UPI003D66DEF5
MSTDGSTDELEKFKQIGLYVYWFSQMENAVRTAACDMLALSDLQRNRLMPVVDFVSMCKICQAEVARTMKDDPQRGFLEELIKRALKVVEDRNRIAHGYWYDHDGTPAAIHASRTTFTDGPYFTRPGELVEKTAEVRKLYEQIWDHFPFMVIPVHSESGVR